MSQLQYNSPGAFRTLPAPFAKTPQQRAGSVAFVAAVHAVILYGLLTTLGVVKIPKTISDLTVVNVAPIPKTDELPPPPQAIIETPPVEQTIVPVVDLQYVPPQEHAITPTQLPQTQPQQVASLQLPPAVTFSPASAISSTHTTPEYPPVSRRLGEQGTLRLKLTIAADGSVGDAMVVNSSGHERLDVAAIAWVKAHWRYQPAKQGAKAIASIADAVVTFRLQ